VTARELGDLYDEHAAGLFAFLLNLTRDESAARDLLQDTFVKLARGEDLLKGVQNVRSFLLRMAHYLAIDSIRRETTRGRNYDQFAAGQSEIFATASDPDENEFRQALASALGELPPDQRAIVHLKLWEGLTFDAIADMLELSPNTAASRYRYGLDKLRERLRPLYDEIK
jgi:RNA polymerase sigma-70 factor (ECF subfamily)